MKKLYSFFSYMVALAILACTNAPAFEISAYWDPVSVVQLETQFGLGNCPKPDWVYAVAPDNWKVLQWYKEMSITNLCIHYNPSDFANYLGAGGDTLAVMNERWPNTMFQYLEAQGAGRKILPGDLDSPYLDTTHCVGSYGCNAFRITRFDVQTLAIGPGDSTVQEFWRPRVAFDRWKGWNRREHGEWTADSTLEYVMPIVVRLVCDIDPPPQAGDSSVIAVFRWMRAVSESATGDSAQQVLYYPDTIRAYDFTSNTTVFDTITLRIDPIDYTAARHYGQGLDSSITYISNPYDTTPDSLAGYMGRFDEYYENNEGRFSISFCDAGGRTFYLYSVEAMDDAYYKMFEAGPVVASQTETEIADAFHADRELWPYMRGWYYDEIHGPFLRSWLRVQQILHNDSRNLPTFFYNGNAFDDDRHNLEMDSIYYYQTHGLEGSLPSTFMCETYYFWGDSTGTGLWWPYPAFLYTRTSSDGPYADTTRSWEDYDREDRPIKRFNGTQSLQRAIDFTYWKPPDDQIRPFLSSWQNDHIADMEIYPGFFDQVQLQHERDSKLWALLQSGSCGPYDVSEESSPDSDWVGDSFQGFSWRKPTSNEIKLEAWLAVAGNADGIMWYWGTPSGVFDPNNGKYQPVGGLFDWDSESDFCVSGGAWLNRTARDSAAGQVHLDILRVAPILESLDFVKTYASRAFETDYPDSIYPATERDILATNTNWYGNPYRSMEAILAWAPDGQGGWQGTAEENPYVQVSRFRNKFISPDDPDVEDYWFLIVNRRALENERRKIRLAVNIDTTYLDSPYYLNYILGDSVIVAEPCAAKIPACANRFVDVILDPGEAELVHFFRGQLGCDTTLAHIDSLTITPIAPGKVRLNWEEITETDDGFDFDVGCYFICVSSNAGGPWTPIGFTATTSYIDSIFTATPTHFYTVQACEEIPNE